MQQSIDTHETTNEPTVFLVSLLANQGFDFFALPVMNWLLKKHLKIVPLERRTETKTLPGKGYQPMLLKTANMTTECRIKIETRCSIQHYTHRVQQHRIKFIDQNWPII